MRLERAEGGYRVSVRSVASLPGAADTNVVRVHRSLREAVFALAEASIFEADVSSLSAHEQRRALAIFAERRSYDEWFRAQVEAELAKAPDERGALDAATVREQLRSAARAMKKGG